MIRPMPADPAVSAPDMRAGSSTRQRLLARIAALLEDSATQIDAIGAGLAGHPRDCHLLQGLDLHRQRLVGLARALHIIEADCHLSDDELRLNISNVVHLEDLRNALFGAHPDRSPSPSTCSTLATVELF